MIDQVDLEARPLLACARGRRKLVLSAEEGRHVARSVGVVDEDRLLVTPTPTHPYTKLELQRTRRVLHPALIAHMMAPVAHCIMSKRWRALQP